VASLLRGDAGVIGDLLGSLVAGPWRAIVKLTGTLIILATVDITLLLGAFVLFPLVAISHRSWIAKIRPLWRNVFRERQAVDGSSAEAFSGLRVVRAFARETAESRRFIVGTHALVRREVKVWWRTRAVRALWALLCAGGDRAAAALRRPPGARR
jgi:ATP-binding cassette subfamily B protein